MDKIYYVYKITNLINGKIYIGCHKTYNIDDGYMGSGKLLTRSINKHGIENFKKEIIQTFNTVKEMFEMESQLVNEEFIKREDTYNILEGGCGGFDYINKIGLNVNNGFKKNSEWQKRCAEKGKKSLRCKLNNDEQYYLEFSKRKSYNIKKYLEENVFWWNGKKHTEESKLKIGKANAVHQKGAGNSQYGKCWIHNIELKENKSIKKDELPEWINNGWIKGRKMKW